MSMTTRELFGVAIILVGAIALFSAMMNWVSQDIGMIGAGVCIAVPALFGYLQMRSTEKARKQQAS
jgi:uncharacterized membrane protein YidH (DUF202 family)